MANPQQGVAAIRAGEVDWANNWRRKVEARQAADSARVGAGSNRWDDRAQRFARLTRSLDRSSDPFLLALKHAARPADTVLDVGAGAGRYALPLAPDVTRVTAVEPSAGMRSQLEREAAAQGLTNISIVAAGWEEAHVDPHDIAFVAHVLYFVRDVVPFLEKLDRSARRACYILHRVEDLTAPLAPLWREIWGRERPPEPGFLDLYNLLFAVGIRANVQLTDRAFAARYDSFDEAMEEARQLLGLAPDEHSHDGRIRTLLSEALVERDGRLGFPSGPQMAIIRWAKS